MFSSLLYALLALATPGEPPRVSMVMECFPKSPQLGDVLIVKITAVNQSDEAVDLPPVYDPTLGHLHVEFSRAWDRYHYTWSGIGHGMGGVGVIPLLPGKRRVVVFEAIELGAGEEIQHDFWTDLAEDTQSVQVQARMGHPDAGTHRSHCLLHELRPRPAQEVEALANAYTSERPRGYEFAYHPQPSIFGVVEYPEYAATPEKLAKLENQLSEGILRHIVKASRLLQLVDEKGEPFEHEANRRRAAADEMLALLDQCQPLEREWLALNTFEWFYYYGAASGQQPDLIEWEFVEAVTERLSKAAVDDVVGHALGKMRFWPFLERPQEATGFVASIEVDDWQHQLYDPLFTRVNVINHSEENSIHCNVFHNAEYWLAEPPFRYRFHAERRYLREVDPLTLGAGEQTVVDLEALQMPPVEMAGHSFWEDLADETVSLETSLSLRVGDEKRRLESTAARGLAFLPRPAAEMEFLESLYAELDQRRRESDRVPESRPALPTPETFGLRGFGRNEDIIEQLLAYEKKLSPGELRDIVQLTRLMREMEETKTIAAVDDVLHFLDALPTIERHALLIRIIDWCQPLPESTPHFRLVDGALKRLPKKLFQHVDYPAARRKELEKENAEFADYGERHVSEDYKADHEPGNQDPFAF